VLKKLIIVFGGSVSLVQEASFRSQPRSSKYVMKSMNCVCSMHKDGVFEQLVYAPVILVELSRSARTSNKLSMIHTVLSLTLKQLSLARPRY
jgi:hypothetical protein